MADSHPDPGTPARYLNRILPVPALAALVLLILQYGFPLSGDAALYCFLASEAILGLWIVQEWLRLWWAADRSAHLRQYPGRLMLTVPGLLYFVGHIFRTVSYESTPDHMVLRDLPLLWMALIQTGLVLTHLIGIIRRRFRDRGIQPGKVFAGSFLLGSGIGAALLLLPRCTTAGIDPVDALFVAVSAICVTGLSTVDVATVFTPLGQGVILILMQIGGLGIMTLTMAFVTLMPGSLSVREKVMLQDMLSEDRLSSIGALLRRITAITVLVELAGATVLYLQLHQGDGWDGELAFRCLFHAVSAFCNAGFSNLPDASLAEVLARPGIGAVIMMLIVLGGIGFPVLVDLGGFLRHRLRGIRDYRSLHLSTRLVLISTLLLLLGGAAAILLTDRAGSFIGMTMAEQMYNSLFLAVSSRTAGFAAVPVGSLSHATVLVVVILMWIGASPASCGGGIKTVTVALAFLNVRAVLRGEQEVEIFGRVIDRRSLARAFAGMTLSVAILGLASLALFWLEPGPAPLDLAFEAVSAWSTTGLSRGITADLGKPAALLLVLLMLVGRVGAVTLATSLLRRAPEKHYGYLRENIPVN